MNTQLTAFSLYTSLDWTILTIVIVSLYLSFSRGLIQEVFSFFNWFIAFMLAKSYAYNVGALFPFPTELLQTMAGFFAIFLFVWLTLLAFQYSFELIVGVLYLSWINRLGGMLFGALRALMIICIILMVGKWLSWHDRDAFQYSQLKPHVELLAKDIAKTFKIKFLG